MADFSPWKAMICLKKFFGTLKRQSVSCLWKGLFVGLAFPQNTEKKLILPDNAQNKRLKSTHFCVDNYTVAPDLMI